MPRAEQQEPFKMSEAMEKIIAELPPIEQRIFFVEEPEVVQLKPNKLVETLQELFLLLPPSPDIEKIKFSKNTIRRLKVGISTYVHPPEPEVPMYLNNGERPKIQFILNTGYTTIPVIEVSEEEEYKFLNEEIPEALRKCQLFGKSPLETVLADLKYMTYVNKQKKGDEET